MDRHRRANGPTLPSSSRCVTQKARHASTLLTFDAVVNAVDAIEAKAAAENEPGRENRGRMNRSASACRERIGVRPWQRPRYQRPRHDQKASFGGPDAFGAVARACGDPRLSTHLLRPYRPPVPASAVVLGLLRRGYFNLRPVGWRLDGVRANLPLPSARHRRFRSGTRTLAARRRSLVETLDLRQMARAARLRSGRERKPADRQ